MKTVLCAKLHFCTYIFTLDLPSSNSTEAALLAGCRDGNYIDFFKLAIRYEKSVK